MPSAIVRRRRRFGSDIVAGSSPQLLRAAPLKPGLKASHISNMSRLSLMVAEKRSAPCVNDSPPASLSTVSIYGHSSLRESGLTPVWGEYCTFGISSHRGLSFDRHRMRMVPLSNGLTLVPPMPFDVIPRSGSNIPSTNESCETARTVRFPRIQYGCANWRPFQGLEKVSCKHNSRGLLLP